MGRCEHTQNRQTNRHQYQQQPGPGGRPIALISLKSFEQNIFTLESGNQIVLDEHMPKVDK